MDTPDVLTAQDVAIQLQLSRLSSPERMTYHLLAEGKNTKEIAAALNVATTTVSRYRMSIFRKLGVRNAVEMVRRTFTPAAN